MKMLGYLVVIKRSGGDGTPFPVVKTNCIIGRSSDCDIRVQLPVVSLQQCQVDIDPSGKAYVTNLGQDRTTVVNDHQLAAQEVLLLAHRDVILIGERRLRWEYPADSPLALTQQLSETKSFRILAPTTKSPISRHNVEDNRGQKRSSLEASCMETPDAKKKRVSFGPNLNPEHFDKLLPPSTPVSKGEKPEIETGVTESPLVSRGSTRKTKRVSTVPVIPEEPPCQETPTKSLLRRRSPTPVKPYLARSMGLQFLKALSDPTAIASVSEHVPPEGETSPPHQASVVENTSPQKSSPRTAAVASLSSKESSLSPGKKEDEVQTRLAQSPKVVIKKLATPDMTLVKLSSSPRKPFKAGTPKKVLGSVSPRKISPMKQLVSPKSTPKKLSSPKSTPKKTPLPVPKDIDIPLSIPKKNKTPEKLVTTPLESSEQLVSVQAMSEKVAISGSSSPLHVDGSPTRANISPKTSPGKPEIDAFVVSPIKETSPIKLSKKWSPSSTKSLRMSPENPWALKLSPQSPRALRLSPSSPDRLSVGINNTSPSFPAGFPKQALTFTPKSPMSSSSPQSERLKKTPQNIARTPKRLKLTPKSALKTSPSPKTLKTPKSSINVSPKTPKSSLKASPKTPKSLANASPKTPKSSLKASPKSSLKASPKTPKSSLKASPQTPKSSLKASPKTPKSSLKASPKTPKSSLKASPKTPKSSLKASPKTPKSSLKASPKTPKSSLKASPKTPKSSLKASPKTPKSSLKASPKTPKSSIKSSPKTPKSSVKKSPQTPKSPVNASSKTPKRTPTKVVTPKSKTPTQKVKTPESVKKIKTQSSSRKVLTPSFVAKKIKIPGSAKKIQSPGSAKKINTTPGSTKKTRTPGSAAKRVVKMLPLSPRGKKRKAEDTPLKKPIKKMKLAPATPATKKSGPSTSSVTKDKTPKKTPGKTPNKTPGRTTKKTPGKTTKKTPGKTPKRPSFADVLKKGLMKRGVAFSRSQRTHNQVLERARLARATRTGNKNPTVTAGKAATALTKFEKEVPKTFKFGETSTTGHANSPASIFIGKKMSKTPRVFKRGRKTPLRSKTTGGVAGNEANFEGLAKLMATPGVVKSETILKMTTPKATRGSETMEVEEDNATEEKEDTDGASPKLRWSPRTPSTTSFISTTSTTATNFTNFDFSAIKTPDITEDRFISPLVTPRPPSSAIPERISPRGCRGSPLLPTSPEDVPIEEDATTFDFENVHTPDVSQDAFVSPDSAMKPKMRRSLRTFTHGLMNLREEKEKELESPSSKSAKKTPKMNLVSASTPKPGSSGTNGDLHQQSSSESIIGMRNLFETITDEEELEEEQADQTINNVSNNSKVVTRSSWTPTEGGDYTDVLGVRTTRSDPCTPEADYTQVAGIQKLMKTPKPVAESSPSADYTQVSGVQKLLKTPKTTLQTPEADYTQVTGVKKLMTTPKNTPKVPEADYTQVVGVHKLMTTPRRATSSSPEADYTQVEGVRKLMKTPRVTPQTPVADYTQVAGIKKLLKTPESNVVSTSPIADYTQVAGVKALLKTPKTTPETPEADYTQVAGVKKLMQTPKLPVPEREADDTHLMGVRKVLRTPKPAEESPKADYTNVAGLRKLMRTPQTTEDPPQSLPSPDYSGIQSLMRTPKSPSANLEENDNKYEGGVGMKRMLRTPRSKEVETDYIQVQSNHKLLKTLGKIEKGLPLADYTDPKGLRNLLATPRTPVNSPEADYSNVHGLRALMRTPKDKKLVELDLQGLVQLVKTPLADQTNVVCSRVQTDCLKLQSPISSFPAESRRKRKGTMTSEVQIVTPNASITSSPSENIPPASIGENSKTLVETGESDHTPRRSRRTRAAKNTSIVTPVRQVRSQHKKEEATPVDDPSVSQKSEHDEVISRTPTRKKLRNAGDGEPEDVDPRTEEEDNKQKQQEEKIKIPSPNVADEKAIPVSTHSILSKERSSSPQAPSRLLPGRRCTRKNADLVTPEETVSSSLRPKRRTRKDAVLDKQDGLSASPYSSRRTKTKEVATEVATVDSLTPKSKVPSPDLLPGTKVTPHIVITPTSLRIGRKQLNNTQVEMVSEELILTPSKRGRNRPNATPSSEAKKGRSRSKKVDDNASVEEMQVELKKNVATPVADTTTPVKRSRRPKVLKEEQEIVLESAENCMSSAALTPVKRNMKGEEEEEEEIVKSLKREEEPKRSTRRKADSGLPEPPQKKRATRTRAGRQAAEEDIGEVKANDETHYKETEEPPQKKTRVLRGRGKSKKATEEEAVIVGNTAPIEDSREVETEQEEAQPQKRKGRATRGKQKTTNKKVVEEQEDTEVEESNTEKEEEVQMQRRRGRPTKGRQQANKKVDESEAENKTVIQVLEEEETTASPHRASSRRLRNTTTAATSSPATPEITTRTRKSANKSTSKATSNKEVVDKEVAAATVEKNKLEEIPATRRTRGVKAAMKSEDPKTSSPEQITTRTTRATRSRKAVS
ncbi:hypothetical protein Pmani_032491 [Petrolisthes manimaculis]|uniref:FHA domain-containing protein n=1 Tax=Petrolisthes manimaculis TaxID=1843537 RepID=A0AAE1TRM3_9EUCA|nr:hypothetical protein Pmani_032491 [Petrolisthes manimaculis]